METLDYTLIKYDALSVEAMDKIHVCLDLLCKDKQVETKDTLRETYEEVLGIYNLERDDPKMWEMVWNHKILSLFQMEQQSGVQGIKLAKPKSVNDLSVLNSVIRLMAPDKDSKTPLEMWSIYRNDISVWIKEMKQFGLSEEEIDWLSHHSAITNGICESQEGLMSLVQEEKLGGNTLTFADKCRKGIAKKQGKLFQECEDIYYENIKKNNCSETLAHYVWDVLLKVQRGYSFNRSHCLAYSLVALQEMNLAFKYPILYWNCACLLSDSGSLDDEGAKDKACDYAKIAKAIGSITSNGINVSLININTSDYGFKPDVKNNRILYGLKALGGVNSEVIEKIIAGRPYRGIKDFMQRCPLNKTAMITLIKSGAFDEIDDAFNHDRRAIMVYYLMNNCDAKKRITLQNFKMLIEKNLIPQELELQVRVFNFNAYLKKFGKYKEYYTIELVAEDFVKKFIPEILDDLAIIDGKIRIKQDIWKKWYDYYMDAARDWAKTNQEEVLNRLNTALFLEQWEKYAKGNLSSWEMDSLCMYYHEHELAYVNMNKYGLRNFSEMPTDPEVDYYFKRGGHQIPIYKLYRIAGTVIAKDDNRSTVILLATDGVVNVKMSREQYAKFKKQVSEVQSDGTKKIIEKSWFKRGSILMLTGFRRDDQFCVKTYASTESHQLYKIDEILGDSLKLRHERFTSNNTLEEDYDE